MLRPLSRKLRALPATRFSVSLVYLLSDGRAWVVLVVVAYARGGWSVPVSSLRSRDSRVSECVRTTQDISQIIPRPGVLIA